MREPSRSWRSVVAGLALAVLAGVTPAWAQGGAPSPPPPPRVEKPPPSPNADAVWIAGYWIWQDGQWVWTGGRWEQAQGRFFIPGRYRQTPQGWMREPGRWQR